MPVAGTAPAPPLHHGAIGLGAWNTAVEFQDVVVSGNGTVLYQSDFDKQGTNGLAVFGGDWSVKDGVLRQTAIREDCRLFMGDTNWANYTVTLRARRTAGHEGFFVFFNYLDGNHWTWFDAGGWSNTLASVNQQSGTTFTQMGERVPFSVKSNVWYDVRVELNGPRIECYLDSKLVYATAYADSPSTNVAGAGLQKRNTDLVRFNPTFHGAMGVASWDTKAEFTNIVVTSNNVVLYRSDFDKEGIDAWHTVGGSWSITNGLLRQTQIDFNCFATTGDTNWANYTLSFQARKVSGDEGFCGVVGWLDDGNRVWFNIGSWGNHSAEIYQDIMGRRMPVTGMVPLSIETGKWYDVRVVVNGAQVSCYLNSNLVQTAVAQVVVSTNAIYLGSMRTPDGYALRFKIGGHEFRGKLTRDRGGPPALESGSLVRLTGTMQPGIAATDPDCGTDCDLQIYSAEDVVLLQPPSWWTWQRIVCYGGALFGILTTAATWIAMISRKNRLLLAAQAELENRVQARTADLAKANAELEHEHLLLRTLLENASDYIYFKDIESKFVRCSASLCKRSGLTHQQITGKTDFDIFREDHSRQAHKDEQEIIRTGRPIIGKLEKEVHSDGRLTWVITTKMPWRNPSGKVIGTFGISCDITSIKETEAKLAKSHEQLVEASRAAGMAEVATGVLHNVGNVLNSVNVSTSLLIDQLESSKVKSVSRVAAMIQDHAAVLADFITNDPRGKQLPKFLCDLSAHLELEQKRSLEELAGLQKNVGHIKEIVAMQQGYARVAGVTTIVNITELLDDVLNLVESNLTRHHVKLKKEFDKNLPCICVDRHKVLQILVNLVRNAKQACAEADQPDKQLTLRATASHGWIRIFVIDNGVGIAEENLTRIFAHGFTTRQNGHGFGLHSSALATKELGGRLSVHSDGPGKGATFILELKCDPEAADGFQETPKLEPETASALT